jgi:hypothetical protein
MVVCTCHPSYSRRYKIEESWSRSVWAKEDPIAKITRTKRAKSMAQAAEHLSSKCEALV